MKYTPLEIQIQQNFAMIFRKLDSLDNVIKAKEGSHGVKVLQQQRQAIDKVMDIMMHNLNYKDGVVSVKDIPTT